VNATIVANPGSLSFGQVAGGPGPSAQAVSISSSGGVLIFSASASTTNGGGWLSINPSGGTTPAVLSVSVNGAGMPSGNYTGSITIASSAAANSQSIPVSFVVTAPAPTLFVTPAALSLSFQIGSATPPTQTISISSGSANLSFVSSATTAGGNNWLSVSPGAGTTPAGVTVSVNPSGLDARTYSGTVTIMASGASNGPQAVPITLTVLPAAAPASPTIAGVMNAATFLPTAVAPGQIISILGAGLGPASAASMHVNAGGFLDGTLGGTRVLFDGIPAPMVYSSASQVSAIAPYAIAGKSSTRLQVEFQGGVSAGVDLAVADTAPGIFTLTASGRGQGAILNQNYSVNSAGNPAPKGSIVMIYATGEGLTNPSGVDGLLTGAVLRQPLKQVSVTIGGQRAEVLYSGSAPGLVAGVLQVNARVPDGIISGAVPVVLTVGSASSPPGVTMAVQ
jgi:uncharacterized protein (TIGR03437 family)